MLDQRFYVSLIATFLVSAPALAKNETLAERGKRMCEEAGISMEDCTILPPTLRNGDVADATPEVSPLGEAAASNLLGTTGVQPASFGTGKYGWCSDCTSVLGAAPVTPWSEFGGRGNRQQREEDGELSVASLDPGSGGSGPGSGDGPGSGEGEGPGDDTDSGEGEGSDDGAGEGAGPGEGAGEVCD